MEGLSVWGDGQWSDGVIDQWDVRFIYFVFLGLLKYLQFLLTAFWCWPAPRRAVTFFTRERFLREQGKWNAHLEYLKLPH